MVADEHLKPEHMDLKGSGFTRVICPSCHFKTDSWIECGEVFVDCEGCGEQYHL